MIKRQKVDALVLSRRHAGEADRVVTFFTREHGLIKAVAKGVRKIPSQRGGHLEPYTKVLALLAESRAGVYVGAVETQEYFADLRAHAQALHHARNISIVIRHLFSELDPQPHLYDGLLDAWGKLPVLDAAKQRLLEGGMIVMALRQAGVLPELRACQICRVTKPRESVVLDAVGEGWRCLTCHSGWQGTRFSLSPRLLQAARFMAARPHHAYLLHMAEEETEQLLDTLRQCAADVIERSNRWQMSQVAF